jgi:hypothetical protein
MVVIGCREYGGAMYDEYRAKVIGTTIDTGTLLSTDYFNSFNEVIMLLGMIPDMPAMIEEIQAWKFRSYEEHFRASGLPFAALAIEAYEYVPPTVRERFESTVCEMRQTIEHACRTLSPFSEADELDRLKVSAVDCSMRLQALVDTGSAIVHGADFKMDQSAVDDLF